MCWIATLCQARCFMQHANEWCPIQKILCKVNIFIFIFHKLKCRKTSDLLEVIGGTWGWAQAFWLWSWGLSDVIISESLFVWSSPWAKTWPETPPNPTLSPSSPAELGLQAPRALFCTQSSSLWGPLPFTILYSQLEVSKVIETPRPPQFAGTVPTFEFSWTH